MVDVLMMEWSLTAESYTVLSHRVKRLQLPHIPFHYDGLFASINYALEHSDR